MKKFFSTLLLFILVACMLLSCGEDPTPTPPDDDDDTIDVTDNGVAMKDPSIGQTSGGIDISGTGFISQLEQYTIHTNGGDTVNYNYGHESENMIAYYPSAEQIINTGRREVPPYGVYGFINEFHEYYDDLVDIGFTNVRLGYHSTNDLNDEIMSEMCSSGISTMYTVGIQIFSNSDLASTTDYFYGTTNQEAQVISLETIRLADWIEDCIDQAYRLLDRYGPNGSYFAENPDINYLPIRYIEVCNEPNFGYVLPIRHINEDGSLGADWANHPAKAQVYSMLLSAMSQAIKYKYGDEVKIVAISDGCVGGTDADFTKQVMGLHGNEKFEAMLNEAIQTQEIREGKIGLKQHLGLADGETVKLDVVSNIDVISLHPYWGYSPFTEKDSGASTAKALNEMRKAIAANDPDSVARIDFWFTECGWQLKGRKWMPEDEQEEWGVFPYNSPNTGVDQLTQAAFLVQNYIYALRNGVSRITFMNMQDTDNCNYGVFNYKSGGGVGDKSWRLSGYAIQNLTTILPSPRLVNVIHEGYDDLTQSFYYMYEFESDVGGENVILAFTAQEKQNLSIPWEEDYALVTDLLGNSQIVATENGYIRLEGGACMMYVRHVSNQMLMENGLIPSPEVEATAEIAFIWQEKREEY